MTVTREVVGCGWSRWDGGAVVYPDARPDRLGRPRGSDGLLASGLNRRNRVSCWDPSIRQPPHDWDWQYGEALDRCLLVWRGPRAGTIVRVDALASPVPGLNGVAGHGLGTAVAGLAAMVFAVGSVVQHEVAAGSSVDGAVQLRRLVTRPAWLLGQLATVVATVLQVVALALAPVSIVQPVLAAGLVVALGIRAVRDRCRPSAPESLGAVCTAGGLAVFLLAARPAVGTTEAAPHTAAVLVAAAVTVGLVGLAVRGRGSAGALACGLAAGVAIGIAAVLISAALKVLGDHGLVAMVTGAPLWAAIVASAAAQYGSQQAFARGALSLSLPALTVVDPLAAVPAAHLLLNERLAPGHAAIWLPAAALAAVGVVLLARHGEGCRRPFRRRPASPAASSTAGDKPPDQPRAAAAAATPPRGSPTNSPSRREG